MATPVGPAAPDPDDPDLWDEWYDDEPVTGSSLSTPLRLVALVVVVAMALLVVFAR